MSERIVIENAPNIYDGLDAAIAEMENRGLGTVGTDIPVCVVLKTTGEIRNGNRVFNVLAYIGATDTEIINDLEGD